MYSLLNYFDIERERDIKMRPCFQGRKEKSYFAELL